ncbi:hypothetical protein GCM10027049_05080 [Mucilaginibacter puniceus]
MKNTGNTLAAMFIAAFIFLGVPQIAAAQVTYQLVQNPAVVIKVSGKSNVHDWTMTTTAIESQGKFKLNGDNLADVTSLSFSVVAKSLKSGKSSMDNRTYKTIKASQYPNITYKLTSATVSSISSKNYLVKTKGQLTIAGVTQPINVSVTATVNADNTITCTGTENIKLTDYGIKPPSFLLGAMKVYDDLAIQFTLIYKK